MCLILVYTPDAVAAPELLEDESAILACWQVELLDDDDDAQICFTRSLSK